jgi:SpoIID/LytB domain protein
LALVPANVRAAPSHGGGAVYQFTDTTPALAFDGQGWGHGIGLCQWGARGRAVAGQSAEQIVGAYYQGTQIQKIVAPETTIRVLLHDKLQIAAGQTKRIRVSGGGWQLETSGQPAVQAPADGTLELSGTDSGTRYAVKDAGGATLADAPLRAPLVLRPQDGNTRFEIVYKPASEIAGRPGVYYDTYRGEILLTPRETGIETVNRVALEDYLRGVVPAEMPSSWPVEALKAQAYAARSYAVWQAKGRSAQRYDVDDTIQYQVYLGANTERENVNRVVDGTGGQAITYNGQVAQAYFFSTCAGWTEDNETVWGGAPVPYLRGIHDVDAGGRPYDADAPYSAWTTNAITSQQLEDMLNADQDSYVGSLRSLDLTRRASSGRLISLRATGSAGTKTIDADAFLTRFNRLRPPGVAQLRSTNFDLRWTTLAAVEQTQGPAATATAAAEQGTPTPAPGAPAPAATQTPPPAPTPAYRLDMTQPAPERPNGATNQFFAQTGHNVGGAFLRFYQERGGLDTFGYPRTEEILEDGQTVQYFQRARFEYHMDKAGTPYEVQLALFGDALTTGRRPFPTVAPFANSADHVFFAETGHGLHYAFLKYWQDRGGLDVFGYPISEEMTENGFTVQYFQRARFEYHPELPEAYAVSLGLLGDQTLIQRLWLK